MLFKDVGRVEITSPLGSYRRAINKPRIVIQCWSDGLRLIRCANLGEARRVKDDWLSGFYVRFPGELRKFHDGRMVTEVPHETFRAAAPLTTSFLNRKGMP